MSFLNPPKLWDIWLVAVDYEDDQIRYKQRPMIIVDKIDNSTVDEWLAIYVTSKVAKYRNRRDAVVLEWEKEQLDKPSVALCASLHTLYGNDFVSSHPIGYCTGYDIDRINDIFDQLGY